MGDLKPCPFCGCAPEVVDCYDGVSLLPNRCTCPNQRCPASGSAATFDDWNRRADEPTYYLPLGDDGPPIDLKLVAEAVSAGIEAGVKDAIRRAFKR